MCSCTRCHPQVIQDAKRLQDLVAPRYAALAGPVLHQPNRDPCCSFAMCCVRSGWARPTRWRCLCRSSPSLSPSRYRRCVGGRSAAGWAGRHGCEGAPCVLVQEVHTWPRASSAGVSMDSLTDCDLVQEEEEALGKVCTALPSTQWC